MRILFKPNMAPRIFIVGTGRSGTSILYKSLGCHPAIHIFPREMRFIVDPGGLQDLVDDLTSRFHPVRARETLYRFERMMRVYMTIPERAPYKGYAQAKWLGEDYYWPRLDQFCNALTEAEFEGVAWQVEPDDEGALVSFARQVTGLRQKIVQKPQVPFRLSLPRRQLKVVKYFESRKEMAGLAAGLVDDLFLHASHLHGKETWCEKTPQHLLALDFIWELFPDSVVIHIKRDPRGVAQSLMSQFWAPSDMRGASLYLRSAYACWETLARTLNLNERKYLEIKLEDFAVAPHNILAQITEFCGLKNEFSNLPEITLTRVDYWKDKLSAEEMKVANEILAPHVEAMGYEV